MTPDAPLLTATRGVGAVLRVPGLADLALPVLLRYAAADPYAVRMVLLLDAPDSGDTDAWDEPDSVEWVFARSLLAEGLLTSVGVGAGDVGVRVEGREVQVSLAGSTTVLLPLEGLVGFLDDCDDVVPTGAESAALPLEQALVALLA